MNTKQIASDAIANATNRFRPHVWAFMAPDIAADIKVAFAIEHAIGMACAHAASNTSADITEITGAIRSAVYGS
jgi:hypothetical protein